MNYGIKTVVLGESTIGKTSITTRLTRDIFSSNTESTVGAAFAVGSGERFGNHKFSFWDTGGQERYSAIIPMYYRDAKLALFVFDMSNIYSMDRIEENLKKMNIDNLEIIVIGNKLDLVSVNDIEVADSLIKDKLQKYNIKDFIYVSTKTGQNFDILLKKIIEKGNIISERDNILKEDKDMNIIDLNEESKINYLKCSYCF